MERIDCDKVSEILCEAQEFGKPDNKPSFASGRRFWYIMLNSVNGRNASGMLTLQTPTTPSDNIKPKMTIKDNNQ